MRPASIYSLYDHYVISDYAAFIKVAFIKGAFLSPRIQTRGRALLRAATGLTRATVEGWCLQRREIEMPDFNDLRDWLIYVKESNAFLIALPSFVGLFLACIADWAERYLSGSRQLPSHKQRPSSTRGTMAAGDRFQPSMHRQLSGGP